MLNLECNTKLSADDVKARLKQFFGPGGLGLNLCEESGQCISFEGGGGYVTATVCPGDKKTKVDLVTQEWDIQAKKFASELP